MALGQMTAGAMEAVTLHLLIFLPLSGAVAVAVLPGAWRAAIPRLALAIGLAMLVLALGLWFRLDADRLVGESGYTWVVAGERARVGASDVRTLDSGIIVRYHVGLDAISASLVVLTAVLIPLSVACSFSAIRHRVREYYAWLLALAGSLIGVFAARDVLLFYIFFELTLVPLYFLIGIWGGSQRRYAARKFFVYTFAGSVITFAGLLYLALRAASLRDSAVVDFDFATLSVVRELPAAEQIVLFAALFCGFAVKVPVWPLHTWLPLAHTEAPTAGSVLLAGVLLKLGTYGFLRLALPLVPAGAVGWAQVIGILAVCGTIYGALCCWVQTDVKRLVAFSSVSHLGLCMLGMFSLVPVGLSGSVLYMLNHGISTGALFLLVGMLYERYHTRQMDELSGLARRMPVFAFFLVLFVLSSIGLPGLNGFVSEFTVLLGTFQSPVLGPWYAAAGASGIILGAIYMLSMTGKVLFGPLRHPAGRPDVVVLPPDLSFREIAILAPLAVLVVVLGVYPRVVTDALDPVLHTQVLVAIAAPGGL